MYMQMITEKVAAKVYESVMFFYVIFYFFCKLYEYSILSLIPFTNPKIDTILSRWVDLSTSDIT
jgi:hypothetical protein